MRLVNADALLCKLEKYSDPTAREKNEYLFGMQQRLETCIELVDDAPTVDAVPVVHGRWIIKDNPGTGWYRVTCSECGEDVTSVAPVIGFFPKAKATWDFCPNCGARMDGKDGNNHD